MRELSLRRWGVLAGVVLLAVILALTLSRGGLGARDGCLQREARGDGSLASETDIAPGGEMPSASASGDAPRAGTIAAAGGALDSPATDEALVTAWWQILRQRRPEAASAKTLLRR